MAICLCRKCTGMTSRELGARLGGVGAPAVSMVASQRDHDKGLAEGIGRCEAELGLRILNIEDPTPGTS